MTEEQESGDGTNLCVSFGGELLQRAEELLKEGIHANDVYKGYELARDKAAVLQKVSCQGCKYVSTHDATLSTQALEYLSEQGIETRAVFYPMHQMAPYQAFGSKEDLGRALRCHAAAADPS